MPQILHESSRTWGELYLWYLTEDLIYFKRELDQTSLDMEHLRKWHPKRQLEWLSSRYLLHRYVDHDISSLEVNDHGKPIYRDAGFSISISHTDSLVGIMVHPNECGLDLQIKSDKINRVAHKFCSDQDRSVLSPFMDKKEAEHYIWGLKECVFKAYGKKGVSFMNEISIEEVSKKGKIHLASVLFSGKTESHEYEGKLRRIGQHFVSQVREKLALPEL